ncbi:hypothetical protein Tco_0000691 [Tanacetum coccineum]
MLESLGLVPQSSNMKFICSKEDDGEVMFIEIIRDDEPQNEDPHEVEGATTEEPVVEYFDTFPTRDELTYHSSILDPRLSQVVLGRPFIEISNMTHDPSEGVVRFIRGTDEVAYKMPHKIEQYDSMSNLKKENTKLVYLRNEEDKRRGVEYVMSKILGFYKECLELGPEYLTGVDLRRRSHIRILQKSQENGQNRTNTDTEKEREYKSRENAIKIRYALTVNLTIYTSCIEQFWATAKEKTVNGERGNDCLPTATNFEELARIGYEKPSQKLTFYKAFFSPQWKFLIHTITQSVSAKTTVRNKFSSAMASAIICLATNQMGAKSTAWNEFSSTMASLIICLATNQKFNLSKYIFDAMLGDMSHHKKIYVNPSHIKKIFANMKREGKDFSERITPLFATMMFQPNQEEGVDLGIPTDHHQTPITTQPSSSRSQKKQPRRKQRKDTAVLDLEKTKEAQAKEIADLRKRVQKLERKKKSRPTGLKRLRKVGISRRVESSKDRDIDDTQGRSNDAKMFDTNELHDDEVVVDMLVGEKQEQSAKEREVNTSVEDSAAPTTIKEITLAQTFIQIKAAKPKVVTTAATTTTTTTRPKARGVVVQEPSEFRTPQESQPSKIKYKGKAIMIEPEVPLKRKDQVALDEDLARNLQAQLEAELIEEERIARKKEEEANIALIKSWDNTQAIMVANFELAQSLQTEEQGEITIKKRSRLFVELMNKRKKHFKMLRAKEKRRKPPTKAQKRNLMSTYLINIGGYKHNQLKSKIYEEIQKLFDNEIRRVNTFIPMDYESKKIESSEEKAKGSRKKILGKKRAGKEQQQESSKRQRMKDGKEIDEHEEVKVVDEAELKKHLAIVKDDDIAIDAIPLATKPPVIVEYKLLKEGIMVHYQLIRADRNSKRYSSMIRMLQGIDREDL